MSRSLWLRLLAHQFCGSCRRRSFSPRSAVAARRRVRPSLDTLEDRTVLSGLPPVTTFADSNIAGAGSLRDAIIVANADTGTATDTIQLQAGTYTLTMPNNANNHDVSGAQGDLNITSNSHPLVIEGATDANGKPTTTITVDQAKVLDRVFEIGQPGGPNGITVTFKNLIIENGFAQDDGGAGTVAGSTEARGGGVLDYGGFVTLSNVVLQSNQAVGGSGSSIPNYAEGGGIYSLNGSLTINNSVLQNNAANGAAGTSTHPDGKAGYGGGIEFYSQNPPTQASVIITNSTVEHNVAEGGPGALASNGNGGEGDGGGIGITTGSGSAVIAQITDSTIVGNTAIGSNGTGSGTGGKAQGGGVYFAGDNSGALLMLLNSTIAGSKTQAVSTSNSNSDGGGIYFAGGNASLTNVTVADNTDLLGSATIGGSGGGIDNASSAVPSSSVTLTNTLVAENNAATAPDYFGKVDISDHNLIGKADGSSGFSTANPSHDLLGSIANPLNPQLGPLQNNGGPTQTMALLSGSPAINAGDNLAEASTGNNDQRGSGFTRVFSGTIDIGAFEAQPSPPPPGGGGGGATASPPSLFQAWISLYLDGIELEAFNQASVAAFKDDFATASALETVLRFFGNPSPDSINASIAFNETYAGPFGPYVLLAGEAALLNALQSS